MIENLFDHRCSIYHLRKGTSSPGYGLPAAGTYDYAETPDIENLACHFGVKSSSINIIQQEPQNSMDARIKLNLPAGTDIRLNDKVVDCDTGLEYTAEQPRNIRNHHIIVYVKRVEAQRPL